MQSRSRAPSCDDTQQPFFGDWMPERKWQNSSSTKLKPAPSGCPSGNAWYLPTQFLILCKRRWPKPAPSEYARFVFDREAQLRVRINACKPFYVTEKSLQSAPGPYMHGNRDHPKIGRFGEQWGFATRKNPHVHAPAVQRQGPGHRAGVDALASVREPDLERHRRPAIRHAPAAGGGGGRERPTGVVGALRQAQPALALPAGTAAGGRHVP